MKVLIVDDSRTMRNILKRTLVDRMGYAAEDVREAGDGVEATEELRNTRFDLVLLDWNMPNMDGFTLLKNIRAAGISTPVIMCTTEGEKANVLQALRAGANNYIVKPMEPPVVQQKIEQTLEKQAAGTA